MKKLRVILSMVLSLVMLVSLIPTMTVWAAEGRGDRVWVDYVEAETTSIRFKFTPNNADETYCLEFRSPLNTANPRDIVTNDTGYSSGMFRYYGPTEELLFMYNGGWVTEDELNAQIVPDVTVGETHDIIVKLDGMFFDGVTNFNIARVFVDGVYGGSFLRKDATPITAINVYGPDGDTSGIDVDVVSVVGAKKGYMNAQVSKLDNDKKQITVDFSETPANYDFTNKTVVKSTNILNGETEIPLSLISKDGSRVVFGYTGELDNSSECMVIFPDGIESALMDENEAPRKLYSNVITFGADKDILGPNSADGKKFSYCDYNNGKAIMWVNQPAGITNEIILTHEDEEKTNLSHVYYQNGTTWYNGQYFSPDAEIISLSLDVKPLFDKLNTVIEFMLPGEGNTPANIVFGSDGYILGLHNWAGGNAVKKAYPFEERADAWLNDGYLGEYKAGEWVNIKLEHDRVNKTMTFYLNGEKERTLKLQEKTDIFSSIRIRDLGSGIANGTPIMRFDNFKIENRVAGVKSARFTDLENNTLMPFDKVKGGLAKVEVAFNQTVNADTLSGNIKLMQGETTLDATGSYDATSRVYTLTLEDEVSSDINIELLVDGVKSNGGETISYKTYVKSYDGRIDPFLQLVDADGVDVEYLTADTEAYVNAGIENGKSADITAQIMVAQYKGTELVNMYVHPKFTVNKNDYNGVFFDDAEPVTVTPVEGADMVKVFMWKDLTTLTPWIDTLIVPVK